MSQRNHFEFLAETLANSYNERDAGLRKAYDEAARAFGELSYQVADQFSIPEREIAAVEGAQGASVRNVMQAHQESAERANFKRCGCDYCDALRETPAPATGSGGEADHG